MDCSRCRRHVDEEALRTIGGTLTLLSAPLRLATVGSAVRDGAEGRYCPACRRQMRLVFGVLAFVGSMLVIGAVLQAVGVLRPVPNAERVATAESISK